jgi:hypothetical protein
MSQAGFEPAGPVSESRFKLRGHWDRPYTLCAYINSSAQADYDSRIARVAYTLLRRLRFKTLVLNTTEITDPANYFTPWSTFLSES